MRNEFREYKTSDVEKEINYCRWEALSIYPDGQKIQNNISFSQRLAWRPIYPAPWRAAQVERFAMKDF
jgi:hypothetical protein